MSTITTYNHLCIILKFECSQYRVDHPRFVCSQSITFSIPVISNKVSVHACVCCDHKTKSLGGRSGQKYTLINRAYNCFVCQYSLTLATRAQPTMPRYLSQVFICRHVTRGKYTKLSLQVIVKLFAICVCANMYYLLDNLLFSI